MERKESEEQGENQKDERDPDSMIDNPGSTTAKAEGESEEAASAALERERLRKEH